MKSEMLRYGHKTKPLSNMLYLISSNHSGSFDTRD